MNHPQIPQGIFALVVSITSSDWLRDSKLITKLEPFEAVHLYCSNTFTIVSPPVNVMLTGFIFT